MLTLRTLTSLNKESRPFLLGDSNIGCFPSFSSLGDSSIWSSWHPFWPCDQMIWSIWAHCPQMLLSLRKNGEEESILLNLRWLGSSRFLSISSESKCHFRGVIFRCVPGVLPLPKRRGILLPPGAFRGAFQENDTCFPVFAVYATYEQMPLLHGYRGRFPGNSPVLPHFENDTWTR